MALDFTDDVRGIVIGGYDGTLYKFYTRHPVFGFNEFLSSEVFPSDDEAEAWVKERFPEAYRQGIEMRVYDLRTAQETRDETAEAPQRQAGTLLRASHTTDMQVPVRGRAPRG